LVDFATTLERILTGMNDGQADAFEDFADLLGPLFLKHFRDQGFDQSAAEGAATNCVHEIGTRILRAQPPLQAVITDVMEERAKDLIRDLEETAELQRSLMAFPKTPPPGLELAHEIRPCRLVPGDFLRGFILDDCFLLASGDASGKGAAAGLFATVAMTFLEAYVKARTIRSQEDLAGVLWSVHQALLGSSGGKNYLTLLLALIDVSGQRIILATAAAPVPLVRASERWAPVQIAGRNLGQRLPEEVEKRLTADNSFDTKEISISGGDVILIYSDGVVDQLGIENQPYELSGLLQCLEGCNDFRPSTVVRAVFADLEFFRQQEPIGDDQTVAVIRIV
jgi:phosphoserine phosphatase RsbU/P